MFIKIKKIINASLTCIVRRYWGQIEHYTLRGRCVCVIVIVIIVVIIACEKKDKKISFVYISYLILSYLVSNINF